MQMAEPAHLFAISSSVRDVVAGNLLLDSSRRRQTLIKSSRISAKSCSRKLGSSRFHALGKTVRRFFSSRSAGNACSLLMHCRRSSLQSGGGILALLTKGLGRRFRPLIRSILSSRCNVLHVVPSFFQCCRKDYDS